MKPVPDLQISVSALARLIGELGGRPAPDGPDPDPSGPAGPISRRAMGRIASSVERVALNPQPIPPGPVELMRIATREFIDEMTQLHDFSQALPAESAAAMQKQLMTRTQAFVGDCGTGALLIRLQQLMERLRKFRWPYGEPPPRPNEKLIALASLVAGAELFNAGGVPEIREAGAQLIGVGAKGLG